MSPGVLELLELEADQLLDELAARDSWPRPSACPRPMRRRAETARKLSEYQHQQAERREQRGWRPRVEDLAYVNSGGVLATLPPRPRHQPTEHAWKLAEPGIEQCTCGEWRFVAGQEPDHALSLGELGGAARVLGVRL